MKTRWLFIIYLALYVTVLSPYIATSGDAKQSIPAQYLMGLQWFIPSMLLVFLIPSITKLAKPLFNIKFWTYVSALILVACTVLELCKIPGLWWSWSTLGLASLVFIIVMNETQSVLVGIAVTLIGLAGFEILYQTGLAIYWKFFGNGFINYAVVVAENLLWIIPSVVIIVASKKKIHFSLGTFVCLTALIVCTTIWFTNGMDIPLKWWQGIGPVSANPRPLFIAISRGSQGFFCVSVATLFMKYERYSPTIAELTQ